MLKNLDCHGHNKFIGSNQNITTKAIPSVGGDVWHALKSTDESFQGFGEAYFSWIELGSIKAWKQHIRMTMNLIVPVGTVCFVFYDSERKSFRELRIGSDSYCRITVPPKIWFGFKGEGLCNSLVLNLSSIPHDPKEVLRMSKDEISFNWEKDS